MRGLSSKIMMPVAIGFVITIVVVTIYLSSALKKSTVDSNIISADDTISQFRLLRGYYTKNVVQKVKENTDLDVAIDHRNKNSTIPLPATMIHDLSKESELGNVRSKLKLYSSLPFPNRKDRILDDFANSALSYLSKNPDGRFVRQERIGGQEHVRVARADRLVSQACVDCHNKHPQTPKDDWQLGQMRGILEVSAPIGVQLESNGRNLSQGIFIILIAGFGVMGGLYLTVNKIVGPIRKIMEDLSQGSDQLLGASIEISNFSQSLSESTTGQASNIEETSSAMEEMASMANQNADHANSANSKVDESRDSLSTGAKNVTEMVTSMTDINVAFDRINTIVRSIDEIAFETNLLSLNASLEATDAGQNGKRFSVVADEVRALSDKASEAAQETVELIQGAYGRIQEGNEIAASLKESFGKVEQGSNDVANLVAEIKAASNEQAQGCEQVNRALIQLDQGTQDNSSSSQQASAASEKLADQANHLRNVVTQLSWLIAGKPGEGLQSHLGSSQRNSNTPVNMKISSSLLNEMSNLSRPGAGLKMDRSKKFSKSKFKAGV